MTEKVSESGLHKSELPHLRLFLSADIVGSTAFKQNTSALEAQEQLDENGEFKNGAFPSWFTVVLQFYQQAEQAFAMQWREISAQKVNDDGDDFFGDPPELWKTIGDEVLFTKRVDHPWQAMVCMHAWVATLDELRHFLAENKLNVKSTAWLADFPLRNNEIVLRKITTSSLQDADDTYILNNQNGLRAYYDEGNSSDYIRDFIGPSIDTGFRITGFASVRKLAISVELTYLLSCEQVRAQKNPKLYAQKNYVLPSFTLKYDGRRELKGVLNGHGYPIFWIDLDPNDPLSLAEDNVINNPKPSTLNIFNLALAFIESEPLFLSKPYMAGCDYTEYGKQSLYQQRMLRKRADHIQNLVEQRADMNSISETQLGSDDNPDLDLELLKLLDFDK